MFSFSVFLVLPRRNEKADEEKFDTNIIKFSPFFYICVFILLVLRAIQERYKLRIKYKYKQNASQRLPVYLPRVLYIF